jgi:hypothetical protein
MKTSFDCFWSLDGGTACPSQTQAKPSATASTSRLSALWQSSVGRPDRTGQDRQVKDAKGEGSCQQGSSCHSLLPVMMQAPRPPLSSAYQSPSKPTLGLVRISSESRPLAKRLLLLW